MHPGQPTPAATTAGATGDFRPVLPLWALTLFGIAFVGPTAPFAFFGVGSVKSQGHFALVYLIAVIAISFTALSYGRMAAAFPEAGSTYAYASRALHPTAGYFAGWVMILDYLFMPMLCVVIVSATVSKLVPAVPYFTWVLLSAGSITAVNLRGIEMTSRATMVFTGVLSVALIWFVTAAVYALKHGAGQGTLLSLEPFYDPKTFDLPAIMSATPIAVLSFLGFDGISTLAEDAKDPRRNVARATILVCIIVGGLFVLQTWLGQLVWPDFSKFSHQETAFSEIGGLVGGPGLFCLIGALVIAQAWTSGVASQASASRLLYGMARDGRLPHWLFGSVHHALRTPVYSVLLMGVIAGAGGLMTNVDQGAELVNFGACLGFMAVNLSVCNHYFVRLRRRGGVLLLTNLVAPLIGFAVCFLIWLSIARLAMAVGLVWTAAGLLYFLLWGRRARRTIPD